MRTSRSVDSRLETASQSSTLSSLKDWQLQTSRSSRGLSHIDELSNRSPGPCYNPAATRISAAARQAIVTERQNELIRKGIAKDTRHSQNKDLRRQEKDLYKSQKLDKIENDKEKLRKKLMQQESRAKLAQEKNDAKQERVMQHKTREATRLHSARARLAHQENEREEKVKGAKESQEVVLVAKAMQRDLKLQEAATQRSIKREILEQKFVDKQSAEEAKTTRRLESALAVRQSLGSSVGDTPRPSLLSSPRNTPLSSPRSQMSLEMGSGRDLTENDSRRREVRGYYIKRLAVDPPPKSADKDAVKTQRELFMSVYKAATYKAEDIASDLICKKFQKNECDLGPTCSLCHICMVCHKNNLIAAHPACAQDCWSKIGLLNKCCSG